MVCLTVELLTKSVAQLEPKVFFPAQLLVTG